MTTAEYEIRSVIESCRWIGSVGVSHSQDQGCKVVTCVNVKLAGPTFIYFNSQTSISERALNNFYLKEEVVQINLEYRLAK
ncbi:hypothetical protein CDAR_383381 [Caerostris darwini]|uniref:Uncharacterized protein n=1 Tax=Caerostris darwini TaxID=1538125 RepID=A0AAV4NX12_9ARAC|nr:hypothetical protein CDAR_383381 [Caerostris darwini]